AESLHAGTVSHAVCQSKLLRDQFFCRVMSRFTAQLGARIPGVKARIAMQFEAASAASSSAPSASSAKPRAAIPLGTLTAATAAAMIDHTLVRAEATRDEVLRLCVEAAHH